MEHLIHHHKAKNIAFIRGLENHMDSKYRLDAYKTVLKENHIKINK